METGPNNFPPEPFTFLKRNGEKKQIQSVGLIFEPDFFTLYAYASRNGEGVVGFSTLSPDSLTNLTLPQEPLYALAYSPEWTLVPRSTFRPEDAREHLLFNTAASDKDEPGIDVLVVFDAVLIYRVRPEAERILAAISPGLRMRHLASTALELMFKSTRLHASPFIWIHLLGDHAMVVAGKNRTPVLATSVDARHAPDLAYFTLFSAKQLELDAHTFLYLTGNSKNADQIRSLLKNHFHTVSPPPAPTTHPQEPTEPSLESRHFMGLYAPICAS